VREFALLRGRNGRVRIYMETDDENDDDNDADADDAHCMLELDRSLSGKSEFYCVGERSAEITVWN